jgi:hypothetical protein
MEMTPISRQDKLVPSGDGATPHGRDLSSSGTETNNNLNVDPKDIVKREVPEDQTAKTIAAMLRRADPSLDAQAAVTLAKQLLSKSPRLPEKTSDASDEPAVGTTLDVSA